LQPARIVTTKISRISLFILSFFFFADESTSRQLHFMLKFPKIRTYNVCPRNFKCNSKSTFSIAFLSADFILCTPRTLDIHLLYTRRALNKNQYP
jgi:hypothetical protein